MNIFFVLILSITNVFSLCLIEEGVDLKSGIKKKSHTTWHVRKYMPFKEIGGYGKDWVKVIDFENDRHWVKKQFISKEYKCGVIRDEASEIFSEPNRNSLVKFVEKAQKYETYKIISIDNDWVQVMDIHSDTGWIERNKLWIN